MRNLEFMERTGCYGGGERTNSWVCGSDRASMIWNVRRLQYEDRFEQSLERGMQRRKELQSVRREIDREENLGEGK